MVKSLMTDGAYTLNVAGTTISYTCMVSATDVTAPITTTNAMIFAQFSFLAAILGFLGLLF
jgi:hypothetical protein